VSVFYAHLYKNKFSRKMQMKLAFIYNNYMLKLIYELI